MEKRNRISITTNDHDDKIAQAVSLTSNMDNPFWFIAKVCFVYFLVFVDLFLNSEVGSGRIDEIHGGIETFWPFIFVVSQTSVQLFIFLTLFLLMCNTYLMRIGLPGVVIADFKYLGIAQLVYLILTVALGLTRILYSQNHPNSITLELWETPLYETLFILQILAYMFGLASAYYYHQVIISTFRLADPQYYMKVRIQDEL